MRWLLLAALVACGACGRPDRPLQGGGTSAGSSAPTGTPSPAGPCGAAHAHVAALYRAEARAKEPSRVDEFVADNTTMVMNDCRQAPDKLAPCIAQATSVQDLEARCLIAIDDEGTEGDKLVR